MLARDLAAITLLDVYQATPSTSPDRGVLHPSMQQQ